MTTTTTPINNDNPFDFHTDVLKQLDETATEMYESFFELMADFQFGFTTDEKRWLLNKAHEKMTKMLDEAQA